MKILDILRNVDIFQGLDNSALELLIAGSQVQTYPRNSIFINEGDQSGRLFVILEGKAKVFLSDEEGKELILAFEEPGGYIGEIGLLDTEPRSASVMTLAKSRILIISREAFTKLVLSNPEFALGIIRGLTRRMRGLIANVGSLALKNVYRRLVGTLMDMSEPEGDVRVIANRLTHQEIADMIGASREMVSRILKDLTTGGYLSIEGRKLYIHRTPPSGW